MRREHEPRIVIRSVALQPVCSCETPVLAGAIVSLLIFRDYDELSIDIDDSNPAQRRSWRVTADPFFRTPVIERLSDDETRARFGRLDLAERPIPHGI